MSSELPLIRPEATVREAMSQLDRFARKLLCAVDKDGVLLGTLTDGDIRRHILMNGTLDQPVSGLYNPDPLLLTEESELRDISEQMISRGVDTVPVVDRSGRVKGIRGWRDLFDEAQIRSRGAVNHLADVPVVIMAGGRGTRLEPLTKVLPKPLIPINDKPMIDHVIDLFVQQGAREFYLILNYKAPVIEAYLKSNDRSCKIHFIREEEQLGTAGGLRMLPPESLPDRFVITNCDILVRTDYRRVLDFAEQHEADLTIVSAVQHYQVPYGVLRYRSGGAVEGMDEKPEQSFVVNTGVYVATRNCLSLLPDQGEFHMNQLIDKAIKEKASVFNYPVTQSDYVDVGQWHLYEEAAARLKTL